MDDNKKIIIDEAIEYIRELYSGNSGGHDFQHSMRVYKNALAILEPYNDSQVDPFIVSLAALLHDADDHKLFNTTDNENARTFLMKKEVDADMIEKICRVINSVSFSKNRGSKPDTIEGYIVQDADRLDAMGAVGVARTFAYGGENGRSIEDSVQHFYDKLLLLKDEINTDAARCIAEERHEFLIKFLDELKREIP